MNHTHQQLERTPKTHHSCEQKLFCIKCIVSDLRREDFRHDLALLTSIDLKRLASHRAASIGTTWRNVWNDILDPTSLQADLNSTSYERRALVRRAQATVCDFLVYRNAAAQHEVTIELAMLLDAIERRTTARLEQLESEGSEPELLGGHVN